MEKCPNCSTDLENHFVHCPTCGQTAHLPRFKILHILYEFFQAIFSVDKSVLSLIKSLALQPGVTAREYVLEKKRKKYFNPFSFLLLVLGLNLSVNILIKPYTINYSEKQQTTQQLKPTVTKEMLPYVMRRRQAVLFIEENINIVGLAAIPLFAFVFWLYFRRTGINYAEHLVAQVFFSSFFSLFSIVLTLALGLLFRDYLPYLNRSLLLFQLLYLTVAYYQFLNYQKPVNYLKTSAATLLALISWVVVSGGAFFLYVRFGS
ncbi:DUF3667 domain-containing protein [Spirosoma endbachense]|uniref:DUF3667 domain-containing protein n=1 Tax=Spirosoma endbachense TaxID=2666025 RepID=A0A6P1VQB5_9BACT|nr:DUF3667 domain-containing protein [Spirosoma endbachense]QHV94170.1 DUF3667 domain-containing protein [Spirosoma endbachense]